MCKSNKIRIALFALVLSTVSAFEPLMAATADTNLRKSCVVLLHGLARTSDSMLDMQAQLEKEGYLVANIDYPSREFSVAELAELAVPQGVDQCKEQGSDSIAFVTHSMGGILVRQYLSEQSIDNLSRVVMLAPPNKGSEVVDELRDVPGFDILNGPAGLQLGTDKSSVPNTLGAVDFELGIIAGTRSINLILSTYLPNPDDGKVSVESAKVEGMCAFLTAPVSHPFIMQDSDVIAEVIHYLDTGTFASEDAVTYQCEAMKRSLVSGN